MTKGQERKKIRKVDKEGIAARVDLLRQASMENPDAYIRFVSGTKGYVRSWLCFYGSDIPEADLPDLADEVYIRLLLYVRSGSFIPVRDNQILACLRTMTKRAVYSYIQKRNRRNEAEAGFVAAQQSDDPISEVENHIDREKLTCDKLHCQMIELRTSGKTYQEIADAFGMKLHQVAAIFYKLRKKMKKS